MKKFLILIFCFLFVYCKEGMNSENSAVTDTINTVSADTILDPNAPAERDFDSTPPTKNNYKYVFVFLKINQLEFDRTGIQHIVGYSYCTSIQSYDFVDEELKYRLMDNAQSEYLNSVKASAYKGKVIDRNAFVFDTYEDASKKRATFTVGE